ncbi:MAG: hypothetical protein LUE11_03805 [Clostridia bacterium]|nr:hypothetical protein [Clostridia bacterium]
MKRQKHREFVYIGEPVPQLKEQEHGDFLLLVQESVLFSLEKRGLLSQAQRENAVQLLEQQYRQKRGK